MSTNGHGASQHRCLTVKQPWAGLLALGVKTVENRVWVTTYRGPLWIHSSKQDDLPGWSWLRGHWDEVVEGLIVSELDLQMSETLYRRGQVLGRVELEDCRPWSEGADRWHNEGQYGWYLTDAHVLPGPFACRGAQGLWTPSGMDALLFDAAAKALKPVRLTQRR